MEKMFANAITLSRLLLTFVVIAVFGQHNTLDFALIAAIALIFALDALDGYIARKRNETSKLGEVLDTVVDRIIENTFWIYFTATGLLPVWMPIAVMTRGAITDALQKSFGYPTHGWTHALTRSRRSRALYGAVKMIAFMSLASATVFKKPFLEKTSFLLALAAVAFCLLRAIPIVFDICQQKKHKRANTHFDKSRHLLRYRQCGVFFRPIGTLLHILRHAGLTPDEFDLL